MFFNGRKGSYKVRMGYLDLFRGLAIFGVFLSHLVSFFPSSLNMGLGLGRYGVYLFYLVSGYTLFYVLAVRDKSAFGYFKYYVARFMRIAPMFYLVLIAVYLVLGKFSVFSFLFLDFLNMQTFNKLVHVEWSIYSEVLFYLLAPFIFRGRNNALKLKLAFLVSVFMAIGWRLWFYDELIMSSALKEFYFFSPFNNLYVFLMGGLVYFLLHGKNVDVIGLLSAFLSILMLVCFVTLKWFMKDMFFIVSDFVVSIAFSLFIAMWVINCSEIKFSPLQLLGKISYSVYLLHFLVMQLIVGGFAYFGLELSLVSGFLVSAIFTLCLSISSYKLIEKNFILLGRRLFE